MPRVFSDEDLRAIRLTYLPFPLGPFPFDSLMRVYLDQKKLRERGQVVWSFVVQASNFLYQPGFEPQAACVVHADPDSDDISFLAEVANRIVELRGTRQTDPDLKAAVALTHPTRRKYHKVVPPSLTEGRTIYCTDLFIERSHLPWPKVGLTSPLLPLIVNPSETKAVMILPARFWPEDLLERCKSK